LEEAKSIFNFKPDFLRCNVDEETLFLILK
jgi:hypothetical protein